MMTLWTLCLTLAITVLAHSAEFKSPVLLTSGGQSADPQLVKTLLTRENIEFEYVTLATAENLKDKGSVLIVLGGSSKGLGAAKVSAEQEIARINSLLTAAHEMKIPVLAMHIGGKNRRGALSDEFNLIGAMQADEIVVVTGGDDDGFFKKIAVGKSITLQEAARIADLATLLRTKYATAETPKE